MRLLTALTVGRRNQVSLVKRGNMKRIGIVTGGSSGIGLAIAKRLSSEGFHAVSWDLNPPPSNSGIDYQKCDVSSEGEVNANRDELLKNGEIQVLINNCGLQYMAPVEDFPLEKWKLLIDVLLTGTFICSKAVLPHMKEKKFGRIINISSIHGKVASPFKSAYISAKHGVLGLAKVLAKETGEYGITVNSICPGFVDTPLMRSQVSKQMELNNLSEEEVLQSIFLKDQSVKELTSPEQVASMVNFLIKDDAKTITGEAFSISGGWGI